LPWPHPQAHSFPVDVQSSRCNSNARRWEDLRANIPEHPLIRHYAKTNDRRPLKISDFPTRNQFHRLGLYQEFYRKLEIEYQIAVTVPMQKPQVIGIEFNRKRPDISERDRSVLTLISPHMVQAFQNAAALSCPRAQVDLFGTHRNSYAESPSCSM
jgi:hypothetical protein